MKNIVTLLFSSALMVFSGALIAQPSSYSSSYSSYPYTSSSTPSYASGQINWLKSYSDALVASQSSSKPIVLLFTGTTWCPACMKLEREVLTRPEFTQAVGDKFVFLKAEFPDYAESAIKSSPYKPLLDRYGIEAFPTIVVINASGQQLYTVKYQSGGPTIYAQELLQKLNQSNSSSMGYYR